MAIVSSSFFEWIMAILAMTSVAISRGSDT